jgi:hypothetical protein
MQKLVQAAAIMAAATFISYAKAADMPVKAAPIAPAPVASGFFASLTGGYYFNDPNEPFFISPNNGGGGGVNCCGSGFGHGWGGRALIGYRWGDWDTAIAFEGVHLTQGGLNPSYSGSSLLHAPDGHYWIVDGEFGYNFMLGSVKSRVFIGPRYVHWTMHDQDQQATPAFTFDADSKDIGARVGAAFSGPISGNFGWMAEGSVAWLRGDLTGTVGGIATPASLTVHPNIFNADARGGLEYVVAPMSKLTVGYQATFWKGALPEIEYTGFSTPQVSGRASTTNHGPFLRFSYGLM